LIRERREHEAVAEHPRAGRERRLDHLANVLRARGAEHEGFGERVDGEAGLDEERSQPFAERRAAGLARRDDRAAAGRERGGERREERRLPAPLDALDRDETSERYADAPVPYGRSFGRNTSTRRLGSRPVLRDITRCCSASWCCSRRTYDVCGVSSTGWLSSSTL